MCGRFTQHYTWAEINALLDLTGPARNPQPHYNLAPTDTIDVVRLGVGGREFIPMRCISSPLGGEGLSKSFLRRSTHAPKRSR